MFLARGGNQRGGPLSNHNVFMCGAVPVLVPNQPARRLTVEHARKSRLPSTHKQRSKAHGNAIIRRTASCGQCVTTAPAPAGDKMPPLMHQIEA
jgi:hypothetical protein